MELARNEPRATVTIYTRRGDGGETSLYTGERVPKDCAEIEALGTIDEAQSALGLARADAIAGSSLDALLVELERDLWILMGEIASRPTGRRSATAVVTDAMVERLESEIDRAVATGEGTKGFAVPGESRLGALLDVARTVVRRAERRAVALDGISSLVVIYLNRLSDLCWALAREADGPVRTNEGARAHASGSGRSDGREEEKAQ